MNEIEPLLHRSLATVICGRNHFRIFPRGCDLLTYGSEGLMPSDAIGIILAIIAETSLPVKAFRMDFRSRGTGRVDAKRLQMPLTYSTQQRRSIGNAAPPQTEITHFFTIIACIQ